VWNLGKRISTTGVSRESLGLWIHEICGVVTVLEIDQIEVFPDEGMV
jgi:hypothetical protein